MTADSYPEAPADPFPRPPATVTDLAGREIEIRAAVDDDVADLVEMYLDFHPEDRAQGIPPVQEPQLRSWLGTLFESECLNVLASHEPEADDEAVRPVGHATLVQDDGGSYELAIFVLRAYQGAAIGTHLLKHLLGFAQKEGIERVWLTVERWNEPAIALYEKVGFEIRDTDSFELEMSIRL